MTEHMPTWWNLAADACLLAGGAPSSFLFVAPGASVLGIRILLLTLTVYSTTLKGRLC